IDVARRAIHRRHLRRLHARSRPLAAAPLFDDDPALAIDLGRGKGETTGKITQRIEAALDVLVLVARHLEHEDGLVKTGVRIDVRAEPRADGFEILHELARLEMRG